MFRYRCPQCDQVLQALEMRAGKPTVCPKCSQPITIPADPALWLDASGQPRTPVRPRVTVTPEPAFHEPIRVDLAPAVPPEPEPAVTTDADTIHEDVVPITAAAPPEPAPAPPAETIPPPRTTRRPTPPPEPRAEPAPPPPPARRDPPRPRTVVTTPTVPAIAARVAALAEEGERVTFDRPLCLRTGADIAVELTDALTSRMKPPPEPPRDLKPSTAAWLLLTVAALTCLAFSLFTAADFLGWVVYLGVTQVAAGYVWIVWLTGRRNPTRGLAAAVPPVTFWYLTQRRYMRYRPLRFVLTGAALVALSGAATLAQTRTRQMAGVPDGPPVARVDISDQPELVQLRTYKDQRSYDSLIQLLRRLSQTDPTLSAAAASRTDIAAELKGLCSHPLADVRVRALPAYARWGGDDARALLLAALRAGTQEERIEALRQLPRWKDPEVARAVASRLGRPGTETVEAGKALLDIGGPVAEQAVIPLLKNDDQSTRLAAVDIIEKVGGERGVAALLEIAELTDDTTLRYQAIQKANAITRRLGKQS